MTTKDKIIEKHIKYREAQHNKYINQYRKSTKNNGFTKSHDGTRANMCREFANYLTKHLQDTEERVVDIMQSRTIYPKCNCGGELEFNMNYCPECGAKIKWID